MKILSFNLRNSNDTDGHSVAERAPRVMWTIENEDPDLMGMQEYGERMENIIHEKLIEKYGFYEKGTGKIYAPADVKLLSSPILWRKSRFDCLDKGYFWLSEKPEERTVSFDDKYNEVRACVWVKLVDRQTGKTFIFMNTHFGVGKRCISESPRIISEYVKRFGDLPIIITGDYNMKPDSDGYAAMSESFTDVNMVTTMDMRKTFHSYNRIPEEERRTLDYCFVKGGVKAVDYEVIDRLFDGCFSSDHYPIRAEVELV